MPSLVFTVSSVLFTAVTLGVVAVAPTSLVDEIEVVAAVWPVVIVTDDVL